MRTTPSAPGHAWSAPLVVDVTWFDAGGGSSHLRPILLALYDMLQRHVPEAHADADRDAARRDGPFAAALRPGVGIPLLFGRALADIARERPGGRDGVHAVVVLLDDAPFRRDGDAFVRALRDLAADAGLLLIPVALHPGWLEFAWLPGPLDMTASATNDAFAVARAVAVELAQRGFSEPGSGATGRVSLFISRTASDGATADAAVQRVRRALAGDDVLSRLFDLRIEQPDRLAEALRQAGERTLLLALHTDHYGDSSRCEEELLVAKQRGLPVVSVLLLGQTERRAPPYGANMLNIVWHEGSESAVLDQLLRVWLHHLHFRRHGLAVARLVGLAVAPLLLSRPPELLDFAQGTIPSDRGALVLYPDPPLPTVEAGVLQRAYPRARLVTPTTLVGCLTRPGRPVPALAGMQVSLSLSESPDIARIGEGRSPEGLTDLHADDLIAHVTLSLVRAGARLAYGGHLKRGGYTEALRALLRAHNQLGLPPAESLRSYVATYLESQAELGWDAPTIWVGAGIAADSPAGRALQLGEMRARMAEDGDALIVMGGKTAPNGARPGGHVGRFPGILEEAWRALDRGKPLFVIGGFGGAARWVADFLLDRPPATPELLDEARLRADVADYDALCRAYDAHPSRDPRLPASLPALADAIRAFGEPLRSGGEDTPWTNNGLSSVENRRLFASRNPTEIAHLIMKGLLRRAAAVARERASGSTRPPVVRLYHGHAADAPGVGAYAVAVRAGASLSGEALLLDERVGGSIAALARGDFRDVTPLPAQGQRLSGDWVCVVPLPPAPGDDAGATLAAATRELLAAADREGLFELAVASWGLAAGVPAETATDLLLDTLRAAPEPARLTLTLCESHPVRYENTLRRLRDRERAGDVSLVVLPADPTTPERTAPAYPVTLHAQRVQDKLRVSLLAPADDTGPLALCTESDWAEFQRFGSKARAKAPPFDTIDRIGAQLASFALPGGAAAALDRFRARPLDVIHDAYASGIPWETLCIASTDVRETAGEAAYPGLRGGVRRRLAVDASEAARPVGTASETRRVLLIVNPRGDLGQAESEGTALRQLLESIPGLFVKVLRGPDATREAVRELLRQPWDVLHYAGHAFFNGAEEGQSGLVLADGSLLAQDVKQLDRIPPFIFLNACRSARVRDFTAAGGGDVEPTDVGDSHGALARAFLTAGARLFIGNFWSVQDAAARTVAQVTYEQLLKGAPAGTALLVARQRLFAGQDPDWANYVLYGDAAWQW